MTSFPAVKGKDLIAALRGQRFTVIRIKGSHHFIRHTDGRATVVLLASILRDIKMTREQLHKLL